MVRATRSLPQEELLGRLRRHIDVDPCPGPRSTPLHIPASSAPWKGEGRDAVARVETDEELDGLYREHGERLWRAVLAFAGDREVANDAVAEAFAQCLGRGPAVRDPGRWIWRAAFRIAAGELKDRRRRQAMSVRAEDWYEIPEAATQILEALGRLSPRQRAAVVLHDHVGYSAKEVAAILGSTAATVRVHLSQGRRRLRALLEAGDA
jgi:RNA polymerase sigma factor (sigma-70 family)